MSKRLEGKTILITGASSGIGKATAIEFARTSPNNLKLILTARRVEVLKEIAQEIKKEVGDGVKVLPVKLDISNPDEVRALWALCQLNGGRLMCSSTMRKDFHLLAPLVAAKTSQRFGEGNGEGS